MSLLTRCVRSHTKITRSSNYSMKSKVANWSIQPQSRVMKMSNVFDDLAHVFFGSSPPLLIAAITAHAQRGEVLICIIKYRKPPSAIRPVQDVQGCCILSSGDLSSWPAISRSSWNIFGFTNRIGRLFGGRRSRNGWTFTDLHQHLNLALLNKII